MLHAAVTTEPDSDGSLTVRVHNALDTTLLVRLRRVLLDTVVQLRPARMILDLRGTTAIDPAALGAVVAGCDMAADVGMTVLVRSPSSACTMDLRAAGLRAAHLPQTCAQPTPTDA
jgi:anti-anti-sigma regulatory factor